MLVDYFKDKLIKLVLYLIEEFPIQWDWLPGW